MEAEHFIEHFDDGLLTNLSFFHPPLSSSANAIGTPNASPHFSGTSGAVVLGGGAGGGGRGASFPRPSFVGFEQLNFEEDLPHQTSSPSPLPAFSHPPALTNGFENPSHEFPSQASFNFIFPPPREETSLFLMNSEASSTATIPAATDSAKNSSASPSLHDTLEHSDDESSEMDGKRSKDVRNAAERKRRALLRDSLSELKTLVPSLTNEKKTTKSLIYRQTCEHIKQIENQNIRLHKEVDLMRQNVETLTYLLQQANNAAKNSSPIQGVDFDNFLEETKKTNLWVEVSHGYGVFGIGPIKVQLADLPFPLTIWRRQVDDKSTQIKASCKVPFAAEVVVSLLMDLKSRQEWDPSMTEVETLGKCNGGLDELYYVVCRSPNGFSDRDFVKVRRFRYYDNGSYVLIEKSTTHPKFPPRKGYVRGEILLSGVLVEPHPEEGTSTMTSITHMDLKGNVPPSLAGFLNTKAPFRWYDSFIKRAAQCSGDLVDCYKNALLRIAIPS